MTAQGRTRVWMAVALGSVLVVGMSAGLLGDRLLLEREDRTAGKPQNRGPDDRVGASRFHFDCRGWDDGAAEAAEASASQGTPPEGASDGLQEHSARMAGHLARRLELDGAQIKALEPVVKGAMVRSRGYWGNARDEFCAMQSDFNQQVTELLRPDQAARFDELSNELAKRSRRHGDGRRGERHGGSGQTEDCR